MLAVTVPFLGKFACVITGKVIGVSKHPDYFEYHYRLGDLKNACVEGLTKFVRVDGKGQVESVLLTEALRTKGTKVEQQPTESLTDQDLAEIASAVELVNRPVTATGEGDETATTDETADEAIPANPVRSRATKRSKKKSGATPSRLVSTPADLVGE